MLFKELFSGIFSYFKAHQAIVRFNLWRYLILPGVLSLSYAVLIVFLGVEFYSPFSAYVQEHFIPAFLQSGTMFFITTLLFWVILLISGYMTYKYFVLIVLSPILSHLSETIASLIYNEPPPPFSLQQMLSDLIRGLIINIRNLLLTLIFTLLLWMLIFIPLIGTILSPILIMLVQSFYDGCGLIDYTLERKRFSVKQSVRFARRNRFRVIGIGLGFILMLLIPLVGWFAAPTYGTIAATMNALDLMQPDRKKGSSMAV